MYGDFVAFLWMGSIYCDQYGFVSAIAFGCAAYADYFSYAQVVT
jgi:hypothetical protein